MTETILWLFAFVLVLGILRSVLGIILKSVKEFLGASSQPPGAKPGAAATRTSAVPTSEALKKDPVCGTYLAPSAAVQKTVRGQTYYFCSAECRDKFRPA